MDDVQAGFLFTNMWIGVLGKALVSKGALKKSDIVGELEEIKKGYTQKTDKNSKEIVMEINNMIGTVNRW